MAAQQTIAMHIQALHCFFIWLWLSCLRHKDRQKSATFTAYEQNNRIAFYRTASGTDRICRLAAVASHPGYVGREDRSVAGVPGMDGAVLCQFHPH